MVQSSQRVTEKPPLHNHSDTIKPKNHKCVGVKDRRGQQLSEQTGRSRLLQRAVSVRQEIQVSLLNTTFRSLCSRLL